MKHSTPAGVSDLLPGTAQRLDQLTQGMIHCFEQAGYTSIKTPTLEFSESLEPGLGPLLKQQAIELFDSAGKRLMLRPDHTTPIARIVATQMADQTTPLDVYYSGPVFRRPESQLSGEMEVFQVGCESFGYTGSIRMAQQIDVCIRALQSVGVKQLGLDIGHSAFTAGLSAEKTEALRAGDYVTFGHVPERGNADLVAEDPDMQAVLELLAQQGHQAFTFVNKGLVKGAYYYTGLIFEIYDATSRQIVASGGQYNQLCATFGFDKPASGFAIYLNPLLTSATHD